MHLTLYLLVLVKKCWLVLNMNLLQVWILEVGAKKENYNIQNDTCVGNCSHYIQLVWDNSFKATALLLHAQERDILDTQPFSYAIVHQGPTQQAPRFAEEESKGVWPELLKSQTEQMVKSPQSLDWVSSWLPCPLPPQLPVWELGWNALPWPSPILPVSGFILGSAPPTCVWLLCLLYFHRGRHVCACVMIVFIVYSSPRCLTGKTDAIWQ